MGWPERVCNLAILGVMDTLQFGVQNIIDGQGIPIAITGMAIVFCVLASISIFIALLPKLTTFLGRYFPEDEVPEQAAPVAGDTSNDIVLAAIAFAFHKGRQKE